METPIAENFDVSRTGLGVALSGNEIIISEDENSNLHNDIIYNPVETELPVTSNASEQCSSIQTNIEVIDVDSGESTGGNTVTEDKLEIIHVNYGNEAEIIDIDIGESTSGNTVTQDKLEIMHVNYGNEVEIIDIGIGESTSGNTVTQDKLEIIHNNGNEVEIVDNVYKIDYDFSSTPYQITGSWKEFTPINRLNFTKGCKWCDNCTLSCHLGAPDGSCILTCSDDNILRIFNLPQQLWDSSQWSDITEMEAAVKISEGELVYDYCWYPQMNSSDPSTCCLASTSRNSTVHLWDGFTGDLRCSYRSFNHMDEIATPHSLSFDADGQKLFCGFEKVIRIFNVDTPGRNFEERKLDKNSGQSGIISCFAFTSADRNIYAAGSYQKTIGIYSEPGGELECLLGGQKGGVTQLQFSPDGTCLYSGGRKDPEILCWDLRNLGTVLYSLRRSCQTNQRLYFDISSCGRYIVSGNQNGIVTIWDVTKEPKILSDDDFSVLEPIQFYLAHEDCVNGVSFHPTYPLLCTSSGQRKYPALLDDDDPRMFSPKLDKWDNSLRLWWIGKFDKCS